MPRTTAAADDKDIIALNAQVAALSVKHESALREIAQLRVQVAWFQRQIFGKKSERRVVAADAAQGTLGQAFDAAPEMPVPGKKTRVAGHERQAAPKPPDTDESTLFFDEKKVPVEVIALANSETEGLAPEQYEVIGERVSHRLAQRPGSYVVLKYVRPVIKRRDTQALSCPAAPVGVIEGSRADVSFIAGLLVDKLVYHLPFYRQHQRLIQAGIRISRQWLTQLAQAGIALLEPIYDAQWQSDVQELLGHVAPAAGVLHTDGYSAYAAYAKKTGIAHAQCWAHSRRAFLKAEALEPQRVAQALEHIGALYRVEEDIRNQALTGADKRAWRQQHAKPAAQRFFAWVDKLQRVGQHPASRVHELTPRLWKQHFAQAPLRSDLYQIDARRGRGAH